MSELLKIHIISGLSFIITGVYFYFFPIYTTIMLLLVSVIVFHIGHGIFIHRYFTHKEFEFSRLGIFLGHLFFIMTNMGLALSWAGMHLKHHKYSGTKNDPHEWRNVGLFRAIISNYTDSFGVDKREMIKLRKEPFVRFFSKYHYAILFIYLIPFAPIISMSFVWKQFTTIVVHSSLGVPNKLGQDTSTNISWLSFLMWGDELHHDHHLGIAHNDLLHKLGKLWEKI